MDQPAGEAYQPDGRRSSRRIAAGGQELHDHDGDGAGGGGRGGRGGGRGGRGGATAERSDVADPQRSVREDGADLAPAVQRDHEAGESRALRRPADRRRWRTRRTGSANSFAGPRTAPRPPTPPRAAQIYIERAGSPREGADQHEVLAPRRRRVARRQVDRVHRPTRSCVPTPS